MKFHAAMVGMIVLGVTLSAMHNPARLVGSSVLVGFCILGYTIGAIMEKVR